ncbi:MAG: hypothetical protein CL933_16030 [Deltaproteobacteria bacterium]|nr:hypothetical protein [Deltaproteobacteria bacterium]
MRSIVLCSVLLLISTLTASSAFAATLNVVGGQLMGASNVLVGGSLYDVQFLDGTCIDLYNGCDEVSDFTFQTQTSAILASQTLLDQVLLDGPEGAFYTVPDLTNGCEIGPCYAFTPFSLIVDPHPINFSLYQVGGVVASDGILETSTPPSLPPAYPSPSPAWDYTDYPWVTYALWSPVPEPSTALRLGLDLTAFAGKGRSRNRS